MPHSGHESPTGWGTVSQMTDSTVRVVYLDHTSSPGGAELALARIIESAPGWPSTLVLPRGNDPASRLASAPFRRVELRGPRQRPGLSEAGPIAASLKVLSILAVGVSLLTCRSFREANIVHANSSRAAVYGAVASTIARKSLVIQLRDAVTPESLGSFGYLALTRLVLPRAKGVIANSEFTMRTAERFINEHVPRAVIPSPVGIPRVLGEARVRNAIRNVGMVARVAEWKGQRLLIDAFARAYPRDDVQLIIVGGTELGGEEYLAELVKHTRALGIGDRVRFTGQVPNDQVEQLIDDFDVCVQSSIRPEPLGQNVLQYLARGRPSIVAGEGGPAEWITDGVNGRTFRPRDPDDLARVMREIESADVREQLSRGALETALPTVEAIVHAYAQLYAAVTDSPTIREDSSTIREREGL